MSEILNLAQKFKTQSEQQAKTIEEEVESATAQLNSFMTKKLKESETIIKKGMEDLDVSNKDLLTMLTKHQVDIHIAVETYLSNIQLHTDLHFTEFAEDIEKTIEAYTQYIEQLIAQREDRIAQLIKSEMKKWVIATCIIAFTVMMLGMTLGALLVSKFSKPTYIIQQVQPQPPKQPPINYGKR